MIVIYLGDLIKSCGDYNFISILVILKRILAIMQVVVPIILILSCIWGLIKMMINPEDKKGLPSIRNKFLAALIFIFIPFTVNLVLVWTDEAFSISACWATAEEYKAELDDTQAYDVKTSTNEKKTALNSIDDYDFSGSNRNDNTGTSTSGSKFKGTTRGVEIVQYALKWLGKKYTWGGGHGASSLESVFSKKGAGVDCSGFTRLVYKHFGYHLSGTSATQVNDGKKISYNQAQAGDLIVYYGHVAIFMGDGDKIVHASNSQAYPKGGIKISKNAKYRSIRSVRRII